MQTILLIEDEKDLAELISFNLERERFRPIMAHDGVTGLEIARQEVPDLILLDQMLPGLLGTEVCRELKKAEPTAGIPVVVVSARGDEIDKVVAFEVGAEDYVVKPFSMRELVLRIKSVLRRYASAGGSQAIAVPGVTLDPNRHVVMVDDEEVPFTSMEFKLLHILLKRPGTLLNRENLMRDVWGHSNIEDTRTLDTHIKRIRSKLGMTGEMIKTVRGFGYKFELN